MNNGLLKMIVVQQLMEGPASGYALAKSIHEKTGWKPSWGSIYPLLSHFEEAGHLAVQTKGKSKIYTITQAGKQNFGDQLAVRERAYKQILEQLKLLASLGDEHAEFALRMMQSKHEGKLSIELIPEAREVREQIFRLTQEEKVKRNHKQISAIMGRTLAELKKL